MRAWADELARLRNWAEKNQHLLGLTRTTIPIIGLVVTAIIFVIPEVRSTLLSIIGWILAKAISLVELAAAFVTEHQEIVLLIAVAVIFLFIRIRTLNSRLRQTIICLDKSVSADLALWDYHGQWSSDGNVISVTDSDHGGLSKSGAAWENYDFVFYFRIVSECAGWIVRAQSHNHYAMIQCSQKEIRPHRRTVPRDVTSPDGGAVFSVARELSHPLSLTGWNKVKTEVRGYGIRVSINNDWVFSDPDFLAEFPLGRVGFRCCGHEHAQFKDIEVIRK